MLAEFVDSKNALKAAMSIQSEICEHQKNTKIQKLEFRIGIDFGEVFFSKIMCKNIANDCLDVSGGNVEGEY